MQIDGSTLERPARPLNDLLRVGLEAAPGRGGDRLGGAPRDLARARGRERARLAGGYLGLGLEPGDRIASLMPNRIDLVVHYLACFRAGLSRRRSTTATPRARSTTRSRSAGRGRCSPTSSGPRTSPPPSWPADSTSARSPTATPSRCRAATTNPTSTTAAGAHELRRAARRRAAAAARRAGRPGRARRRSSSPRAAPARPRASPTRRETLRWMIASAAAAFELTAEDVFLPGSSMSHVGSFLWALATLSVGGRSSSPAASDSHELLPLLREHRPTVLAMIPAALSALVRDHDLRPRRLRLAADLPRRLRQGLDRAADRVRRRGRLPDRRGLRDDRGRPGDPQPALGRDQAGLDRHPDRRLLDRPARRGRRADRGRGGRPDLDPHPQPDGRLLGGARGDRRGRPSTAGSTPATSPAPTRTATSGSSAARSR